ncbi:aminotransferase class I/II-fold pyridoxal phosphate-dependent enzyme [Auraticoccus sp. F435]|uniref:Aminotransferase class I/II-fold pyridoxal phosphate-dependent enzyme n=1 Tax=Auraticoccus cholistanensis TaxID=2656650 RepID=A0A6A9USU6_9ACTN|nr:PLP-dependent aminotransferase family protein [Auraticoccus cholistanensis]MVA74644.1 aminotransferase class I/II-fold pyridoxal phosphate-dependent enzyme [Auraticoccus cholistanensis]
MTASSVVPAAWLAERLSTPTAHAIAADLGLLIRRGDIAQGAKLPPVRELAAELGVSPATVSSAWQRLRARGVVGGRGRAGITVLAPSGTPRPARYEADNHYRPEVAMELDVSIPDRALLPDLQSAVAALGPVELNAYHRERIVPRLAEQAARTWPYPVRSLMAVNGGYAGLQLVLHTFVQEGDWVLVENPSPPRMLDLVDSTGARTSFLTRDAEGIVPAALAAALERRPAALVMQPGVHNPMGTRMSGRRRDELAALLTGQPVLVVEDDGTGALVGGPLHSVAERRPESHVFIRSYAKSHGPDLRLAVLEGSEDVVAKVHSYRGYGSGWTSRLLQEALAAMLADPVCSRQVAAAMDVYDQRREALWRRLTAAGLDLSPGEGLDLWLPVRDEGYALGVLAAHGIAVSVGSRFTPAGSPPHIRVSTSGLDVADVDRVARLLLTAVH